MWENKVYINDNYAASALGFLVWITDNNVGGKEDETMPEDRYLLSQGE